jgi:hypothetical protein
MKHHVVAALTMAGALALLPATADARGGGFHGGGFHGGGFGGGFHGGFGGFHGGGLRGAGFGAGGFRAGRIGAGGARVGLAGVGAAHSVASNEVTIRNVVGRGAFAGRGFNDRRRFGFRRGIGYGGFGYGGLGLGLGLGLAAADYGYGYYPDYYYGGPVAPAYGYAPVAYGTAAAPAPAADQTTAANQTASCEARFKSYNPATGTYLGYDGKRHPCP